MPTVPNMIFNVLPPPRCCAGLMVADWCRAAFGALVFQITLSTAITPRVPWAPPCDVSAIAKAYIATYVISFMVQKCLQQSWHTDVPWCRIAMWASITAGIVVELGIGYANVSSLLVFALPQQWLWFGKRASQDLSSVKQPSTKRVRPIQEVSTNSPTLRLDQQDKLQQKSRICYLLDRALRDLPDSFHAIQGFDISWGFEVTSVERDANREIMVHYSLSSKVCAITACAIMKQIRLSNLKRGLPRPYDLRDELALRLKVHQVSAARGYAISVKCITEHQAS
eukprot:12398183-Karenia_brevis.AAC.1